MLMLNTVTLWLHCYLRLHCGSEKINITGTFKVLDWQDVYHLTVSQQGSHTNCTSHHAVSGKQHFLLQIGVRLYSNNFPNRELLFALVRQFKSTISLHSKCAYSARCRRRAISYSRSLFPGGTCDQMDHTALMEAKRGASWVS